MVQYCRACLDYIGEGTETHSLFDVVKGKSTWTGRMFRKCVPEMKLLNIVKDPVICNNCYIMGSMAYDLKLKCLLTENYILNFLKFVESESVQLKIVDLARVCKYVMSMAEKSRESVHKESAPLSICNTSAPEIKISVNKVTTKKDSGNSSTILKSSIPFSDFFGMDDLNVKGELKTNSKKYPISTVVPAEVVDFIIVDEDFESLENLEEPSTSENELICPSNNPEIENYLAEVTKRSSTSGKDGSPIVNNKHIGIKDSSNIQKKISMTNNEDMTSVQVNSTSDSLKVDQRNCLKNKSRTKLDSSKLSCTKLVVGTVEFNPKQHSTCLCQDGNDRPLQAVKSNRKRRLSTKQNASECSYCNSACKTNKEVDLKKSSETLPKRRKSLQNTKDLKADAVEFSNVSVNKTAEVTGISSQKRIDIKRASNKISPMDVSGTNESPQESDSLPLNEILEIIGIAPKNFVLKQNSSTITSCNKAVAPQKPTNKQNVVVSRDVAAVSDQSKKLAISPQDSSGTKYFNRVRSPVISSSRDLEHRRITRQRSKSVCSNLTNRNVTDVTVQSSTCEEALSSNEESSAGDKVDHIKTEVEEPFSSDINETTFIAKAEVIKEEFNCAGDMELLQHCSIKDRIPRDNLSNSCVPETLAEYSYYKSPENNTRQRKPYNSFSCAVCGYSCISVSNLIAHTKIHTTSKKINQTEMDNTEFKKFKYKLRKRLNCGLRTEDNSGFHGFSHAAVENCMCTNCKYATSFTYLMWLSPDVPLTRIKVCKD